VLITPDNSRANDIVWKLGLQKAVGAIAYKAMSTSPPNPSPGYPVPPQQTVAPTPRSKKANLAFYIGGGCLILVVLALVTCSVAARSCAHLVSSNPVVLGRIIAAANPNLDVIDVNEAKGTIKVRDKNSNKTFYINLTDAKKGKIEIVDEDGKGVRITGDGGNGKIEVSGDDGEKAVVTTGDKAQQGGWVPVYPGAKMVNSVTAQKAGIQSGVYTFQTTDSPQQVLDFFKDKLKADGFTVSSENSVTNQMDSLQLAKDDRVASFVVTHQGETTVVVTYGAK
jgi:hypothetical protein